MHPRIALPWLGHDDRLLDLDFKDQGADLDLIPLCQGTFPNQPGTVDQGAIGAPEVAQVQGVFGDAEHAMLPAHPGTVGPDVTLVTPTNDKLALRKKEAFPLGLTANNQQLHVHGGLLAVLASPANTDESMERADTL
jgi:hypothetical protein